MAPGSTQPLAKMSTRNVCGGKGGRCVKLTTSPPSRAECHEIWEPKPPRTLWATPGLLQDSFTFNFLYDAWDASSDHLSHSRSLIPVVSQFGDVTEHLSCQFTMHGMNNMKRSKLLFDYILHSWMTVPHDLLHSAVIIAVLDLKHLSVCCLLHKQ